MLFCGHNLDIQPLSDNSLLWISSPREAGSGPDHITVSDIVFASSHISLTLFLEISDWQSRTSLVLTWITILLNLRLALANTFKFAKMSGTLAPGKQWTMVAGVSIFMFRTIESPITRALSSGFSCFNRNGKAVFWPVPMPPHSHPISLLHGLIRNQTMYRTPWASRIQSRIYSPHILTILN